MQKRCPFRLMQTDLFCGAPGGAYLTFQAMRLTCIESVVQDVRPSPALCNVLVNVRRSNVPNALRFHQIFCSWFVFTIHRPQRFNLLGQRLGLALAARSALAVRS